MKIQEGLERPTLRSITGVILVSCLIIVLPGIAMPLFGWLQMLLPLLAFYVLNRFGGYTGKRFLVCAGVLSAVVFFLLKSFELFIFSSILLSAGYVLFGSASNNDSPAISGLKTIATISLGWILTLFFFTLILENSPYSELIYSLNEGISEALIYYRQSDTVSSDTLVMVENTLHQMKFILPVIMPSILGSLILLITWFTMVIGNNMLLRQNGISPWQSYDMWQLPERLIWVVIALGLAAILPVHLIKIVGINGLILISIIYCFQGLAITVFFMNKWKVPVLLRSFFYVMMIFQSFGTILLLIAGVSDIWFDFRKLKQETVDEE